MYNVVFNDGIESDSSKVTILRISENVVKIKGVEKNTSGYRLYNMSGQMFGDYTKFTTLWREEGDWFWLSDDGSIYVEPEPDPEPVEPTLEEVKETKVVEMNQAQQSTIVNGLDIQLSDGSVEHFDLTEYDQISLMGLQAMVASGMEQIPWHTSDNTEHCKFYSNVDMQIITTKALNYVAFNVTYFRDLRIYIYALSTKEKVSLVTYGMDIPVEYQSEPLKQMLAQMNA